MDLFINHNGVQDDVTNSSFDAYLNACDISAALGRPMEKRKVSETHGSKTFNEVKKSYYVVGYIKGDKLYVF